MDVKTLCLGVLATEDRSGYEIKKTLEERFRHFFRAGYGSIYPALKELERSGLVVCEAVEQQRRPAKKVYRITDAGRRTLEEVLVAEDPRHVVRSEFLVLMYFAHLLPAERVTQVIDAMTAEFDRILNADLEALEQVYDTLTPGQRFALGYGRTMLTAALGYLHRQRGGFLRELQPTEAVDPELRNGGLAAAGD